MPCQRCAELETLLAAAREQLRLANIDWANTEAEAATLRRERDEARDIISWLSGYNPRAVREAKAAVRARAVAKDGDA